MQHTDTAEPNAELRSAAGQIAGQYYGGDPWPGPNPEFDETLAAAEQCAAKSFCRTGTLPRYDARASILTSDVSRGKTVQQHLDEVVHLAWGPDPLFVPPEWEEVTRRATKTQDDAKIGQDLLRLAHLKLYMAVTPILCRIYRAVLGKEIDVISVEFERLQAECAIAYRSVLQAAAAWIAGDDDPLIRFLEAIRPLGITVVDQWLRDELADRRRAKAEADEQVRRASWAVVPPYEPASEFTCPVPPDGEMNPWSETQA